MAERSFSFLSPKTELHVHHVNTGFCYAELASAIQSSPLGGLLKVAGVQPKGGSEGVVLEGPLAAALRRGAYWYRQPTDDQKLRVGRSWLEAVAKEFQRSRPSDSSQNTSSSGSSGPTPAETPPSPPPQPPSTPPAAQSNSTAASTPTKGSKSSRSTETATPSV